MIIAEKGRIVTIGSNAGILAFKDGSAYSMSKHAIEAFTDSLAQEMAPHGVQVSVIEPGGFKTEIFKTAALRAGQDPKPFDRGNLQDPGFVALAAEHALFAPTPKRRYLVVAHESEAEATIKGQITRLVELNEGHAFTYDRQELVRMLNEALANSRPHPRRRVPHERP